MLPGDDQRERAVDTLKRAYAEGRLELDDFASRAGRVLEARSAWDVRLQLRGLMVDQALVRARRGARIAGIVAVWWLVSIVLAASWIVVLIQTHASVWTLVFPAAWILVSLAARRELRRVR
jgi:2-keto-3-deoxy-galactonokinase